MGEAGFHVESASDVKGRKATQKHEIGQFDTVVIMRLHIARFRAEGGEVELIYLWGMFLAVQFLIEEIFEAGETAGAR